MTSTNGTTNGTVRGPALSLDQARRYARHIILPEVGSIGQRKLLAAKVLLIGAGGLGSPAAHVPGRGRRGHASASSTTTWST